MLPQIFIFFNIKQHRSPSLERPIKKDIVKLENDKKGKVNNLFIQGTLS